MDVLQRQDMKVRGRGPGAMVLAHDPGPDGRLRREPGRRLARPFPGTSALPRNISNDSLAAPHGTTISELVLPGAGVLIALTGPGQA